MLCGLKIVCPITFMTLCILLKELKVISRCRTSQYLLTIFGASSMTCSNDWKTLNPNFMTKNWRSVKSRLSENVEWMVGGEWQGWIGGGRLPPYPGGLHIIWAAALSAEPTLICGPRPHYGLDPHSRLHNATQGSTSAQSVRQCARVLGGKKRPDVPVPGGPGLYRLPKIGKLQKLGNWGCGRRPTGMLQFLSL